MSTWCFKKLKAAFKSGSYAHKPTFYADSEGLAPLSGIPSRMRVGGAQAAGAPWPGTGQVETPISLPSSPPHAASGPCGHVSCHFAPFALDQGRHLYRKITVSGILYTG